tara:strand:+ start:319 stop:639 length:321 start_codon:yes stop_codon:yes gene_type:complete
MSRLNKAVTPHTIELREEEEESYIPQHPMLQYKAQAKEKTDHLVNYVEIDPFEDSENIFGDMYRSAKKKVTKIFKKGSSDKSSAKVPKIFKKGSSDKKDIKKEGEK